MSHADHALDFHASRRAELAQYGAAQDLELQLGDPHHPHSEFSFDTALALDEAEAFPEQGIARLNRLGYVRRYIPQRLGGGLRCFEECLAVIRMVARRDLTLCLSHGQTFLGSMPVWLDGDEAQQRHLAKLLAAGAKVPLALTERDHGTDILANETAARRVADGYEISGEKWLINLGTQSHALTVQVRTTASAGPKALSLLLIEKAALQPGTYAHVPRVHTLGMRGADISGVRFERAIVPLQAVIGAEGSGFNTLLRTLQISRTLVVALSLGAADTSLRLSVQFARDRRLYDGAVFDLPEARHSLCNAFVDLLCCECATIGGARGLTVVPGQFSIWSAVIKYWVPTAVERLLHEIAVVLGARHYLRAPTRYGLFQKMLRDNAVVGVFDGSTVANLHAIATQLRVLSLERSGADDPELRDRLQAVFSLGERVPAFDGRGYAVSNRGQDDVIAGIPISLRLLQAARDLDPGVQREFGRRGRMLEQQVRALQESVRRVFATYGAEAVRQPELFACARRYAHLHVAAACLHVFAHARHQLDEFGRRGAWAVACLGRLLGEPLWAVPGRDVRVERDMAARLIELTAANRLYSLIPLQLAGPSGSEPRSGA